MRRRIALATAALLALTSLTGCDFFEEFWGSPDEISVLRIPLSVTLPEQFPITTPDATTVQALPVDENGNRVLETCEAGATTACLPPIYMGDLSLLDYDESGELQNANGTISAIEIAGVSMNILSNGMNVEAQPLEIRVGSPDSDFYGALPAARTPIVPAGATGLVEGDAVDANRAAVGQELRDLEFGMGVGSSVLVPADVTPNGGQAMTEVILDLVIVFELDPT